MAYSSSLYHPALNPYGCGRASDDGFWHTTAVEFKSLVDCYDETKLRPNSGLEADNLSSGREMDLYTADRVRSSDILDLRMSANRVPHSEIIEEYSSKAIRNEIRGWESVPRNGAYEGVAAPVGGQQDLFFIAADSEAIFEEGDLITIKDPLEDDWSTFKNTVVRTDSNVNGTFIELDSDVSFDVGEVYPFIHHKTTDFHQQLPLITDIISTPEAMFNGFENNYVEGDLNEVCPVGFTDTLFFSKKILQTNVERMSIQGSTYTDETFNHLFHYNYHQDFFGGGITYLYRYRTNASAFKASSSLNTVKYGKMIVTNNNEPREGCVLASNIMKYTPSVTASADRSATERLELTRLPTEGVTNKMDPDCYIDYPTTKVFYLGSSVPHRKYAFFAIEALGINSYGTHFMLFSQKVEFDEDNYLGRDAVDVVPDDTQTMAAGGLFRLTGFDTDQFDGVIFKTLVDRSGSTDWFGADYFDEAWIRDGQFYRGYSNFPEDDIVPWNGTGFTPGKKGEDFTSFVTEVNYHLADLPRKYYII